MTFSEYKSLIISKLPSPQARRMATIPVIGSAILFATGTVVRIISCVAPDAETVAMRENLKRLRSQVKANWEANRLLRILKDQLEKA